MVPVSSRPGQPLAAVREGGYRVEAQVATVLHSVKHIAQPLLKRFPVISRCPITLQGSSVEIDVEQLLHTSMTQPAAQVAPHSGNRAVDTLTGCTAGGYTQQHPSHSAQLRAVLLDALPEHIRADSPLANGLHSRSANRQLLRLHIIVHQLCLQNQNTRHKLECNTIKYIYAVKCNEHVQNIILSSQSNNS
jgi:hypothetical protein